MDKLSLDLDDLEVDSFQTNPEQEDAPGTIRGNGDTELDCESVYICASPGPTCDATCGDTCYETCQDYCSDAICPQ